MKKGSIELQRDAAEMMIKHIEDRDMKALDGVAHIIRELLR